MLDAAAVRQREPISKAQTRAAVKEKTIRVSCCNR